MNEQRRSVGIAAAILIAIAGCTGPGTFLYAVPLPPAPGGTATIRFHRLPAFAGAAGPVFLIDRGSSLEHDSVVVYVPASGLWTSEAKYLGPPVGGVPAYQERVARSLPDSNCWPKWLAPVGHGERGGVGYVAWRVALDPKGEAASALGEALVAGRLKLLPVRFVAFNQDGRFARTIVEEAAATGERIATPLGGLQDSLPAREQLEQLRPYPPDSYELSGFVAGKRIKATLDEAINHVEHGTRFYGSRCEDLTNQALSSKTTASIIGQASTDGRLEWTRPLGEMRLEVVTGSGWVFPVEPIRLENGDRYFVEYDHGKVFSGEGNPLRVVKE